MRECHRCGVELRPGQCKSDFIKTGHTDGLILGDPNNKFFFAESRTKVYFCKNCARIRSKRKRKDVATFLVVLFLLLIPFSIATYYFISNDPKYKEQIENLNP